MKIFLALALLCFGFLLAGSIVQAAATDTSIGNQNILLGKPCTEHSQCNDGTRLYSCKTKGTAQTGYCSGPCQADGECGTVEALLGWKASTCTGSVGKPGFCLEAPPKDKQLSTNITDAEGLMKIIDTVLNWIFALFVVISIVMVILAGLQFVTAGGKAESVSQARQKLIWAAVGILVALASKAVVPILRTIAS